MNRNKFVGNDDDMGNPRDRSKQHTTSENTRKQKKRGVWLKSNLLRLFALLVIFVFGTVAIPAAAASVHREIIDLGTLYPTDTRSSANAINNQGEIVGWSQDGAQSNGFLWTERDGMVPIGSFGGPATSAIGINNKGQVVGLSTDPAGQRRAFIWSQRDGISDLGTLGGSWAWALGINNRGQVVGESENGSGQSRAFLWTKRNGMIDLGTLGGASSQAFDINNSGNVVGSTETTSGITQAFMWTPHDGMIELESFGGGSAAYGINNHGQVVGESCFSGDFVPSRLKCSDGSAAHAFLWTAQEGVIDLGTLGGEWSWASGINNRGEVVGTSSNAAGEQRAFLWTAEEGMIELGILVSHSGSAALRLNERGEIVGSSGIFGGNERAVLWTKP